MNYLEKYSYTPDMELMGRALELIAANLENIACEQVYKECFSMMDLTTLKTDDTPVSVAKLVEKVNSFNESYPEWPLPASICVYPNFAAVVNAERKCDFNITVVSACFPSSQSFLEVKLKECEIAVEQGADEVDIVLALNAYLRSTCVGKVFYHNRVGCRNEFQFASRQFLSIYIYVVILHPLYLYFSFGKSFIF